MWRVKKNTHNAVYPRKPVNPFISFKLSILLCHISVITLLIKIWHDTIT